MTDQWNSPSAIRWLEDRGPFVVPIGQPLVVIKDDHRRCRCEITDHPYGHALAQNPTDPFGAEQ